jgi:MYXO-CTERM domain-containing protein
MTRKILVFFLALTSFLVAGLLTRDARAAGTFKLKSTEAQEVSGAWHIFVTIELPRAPTVGHVPIRFLFTKTAVYERAMVDNRNDPVVNRMSLQNQTPSIESLDVDFADGSGKIFKQTRFDFGLTRTRGYEAGEYIVQVRTADGTDIGGKANLTLKGDNPVVDRRSITFNAKEGNIKKVDTGIDGGLVAKNSNDDVEHAGVQTGDINATGTAKPFIPEEAYKPTPEEQGLKEHPKGCGCSIPGTGAGGTLAFGTASLVGIAAALARRRRHRP